MTTVVVKSIVMVRNYLTVKTFLFIYHLYELGRSVCRCVPHLRLPDHQM